MTTIKTFLTEQNLPAIKIWYFINDSDKKKISIGEKNNMTLKAIDDHNKTNKKIIRKPEIYIKNKEMVPLSKTEYESLVVSYTIFVKYVDKFYCVDIDEPEIHSMDEFVAKTKCDHFKTCPWIKGNTKGIHIYVKINNMIKFKNQQNVFNDFTGDFIKTNNMWEKIDKLVNNYYGEIPTLEYEDIKSIFNPTKIGNGKETQPKPKKETPPVNEKIQENEKVCPAIVVGDNNYNKQFITLALAKGLFVERAQEHNYDQWASMGWAIKNVLGEDGCKLFHTFSELSDIYNEANVKTFWDNIDTSRIKKLTIKSIIKWAKDENKDVYNEVVKELKKLTNKDKIVIKDDNDGANRLLETLKDILIPCKGQLFYKTNHIWINDDDTIKNKLLNLIMESNFYIAVGQEGDTKSYSQFMKNAKSLFDALIAKIKSQNDIVDIYEKFHSTTKGRLCFKDGVLDFKQKKFYKWEDVYFEYYSCVMIDRNYAEYFNKPDRTIVDTIKKSVYENLYGKSTTKALNFLARGIAGHAEDKKFSVYKGKRNCGKGIQYENLKSACGDYVRALELGNLLTSKFNPKPLTEVSRMNYWMLDFQFVRLGISQETPTPEANLIGNGVLIKKMCGGGDEQIARRNFDKKDTHFKIQTTFQIMGNDELDIEPKDTWDECLKFYSVNKFITKDEMDHMKKDGATELEMSIYKQTDPNMKTNCHSDDWKNATIYLLYENYIPNAVEINRSDEYDEDDKNFSLRRQIINKFDITQIRDDIISTKAVEELLNGKKKDIGLELESMGVLKKKNNNKDSEFYNLHCYYGLVLKPPPKI
jgi:hypothetical protein